MKTKYVLCALVAVAMTGAAQAQTSVKLGVLNDRSGVYSDLTGEGSVIAARMAVEDFKAPEKGITRTSPMSAPASPGSGTIRRESTSFSMSQPRQWRSR